MDFNAIGTTPWGRCAYNRFDTLIGKCIGLYSEFSEEELDTLRAMTPPGSVVLDVGANIGALAIPMAQHVGPAGAVVAFEPQRLMYQLLCANAAINSVPNLYALRTALGHKRGEVSVALLDPAKENAPGRLQMNAAAAANAVERVAMMRVDDFDPGMLERVSLIKIDVEGMEGAVIGGAVQTIDRARPVLYVENDRADRSAALIAQIMALGYVLYWDTPRLVRYRHNLPDSPVANIHSENMLCLPMEKAGHIDLQPVLGPDDTAAASLERETALGKVVRA